MSTLVVFEAGHLTGHLLLVLAVDPTIVTSIHLSLCILNTWSAKPPM